MRKLILSMIVVGLAATLWSCKTEEKKQELVYNMKKIPLKDFFKNPEKAAYKISPDGKYFSFMAPYKTRMNIFVQEIGKNEATRLTSETDRDVAGYFWASDSRILFLKDKDGDENYKLFGVDLDGSNLICLTDFEDVKTHIIDDLEDIPDEVIIGLNKRDKRIFDPYRLNIVTGELYMLAENPGTINRWMTDHDGKLRIATTSDGVNTSILYRDNEEEEFRVVLTTNFKETLSPLFFTFDNKNVYAASNIGRDKSAIVEYDIANAEEVRVLYEDPDYDVSGLHYSRKRKVLTAISWTSWKRQRHFLDKDLEDMFKKLEKKLGDYEIGLSGANKDEDVFIVRTYSDKSLGAYYIYDKNTDKLDKIVDVSPWLNEEELVGMEPIEYKSRDGLTIHGYLTLPKVNEARNLPVVVNPHGGPWHRDSWGFNSVAQFLANRGYAVLQMNFRGSTGYGREFWEASFKEWGRKMQDDVTDGVQYLIDEGIADPDRVAIFGGSYGGYSTLAGLCFTPDLYACGVDYVGVSNLFTFMETIPPYWELYKAMMYEMVGDPTNEEDSIQMRNYSPAYNADKITAPLFIAQGANDPRVKKSESDQMVEAMKARGVDVEYMVKDNEGHGFRNEENRFEFFETMEAFLAKHIGGAFVGEEETSERETNTEE